MLSNMAPPFSDRRLAALQSLLARVARAIDGALRDELTVLDLTPAQAEAIRFAGTIRPDVATVGQLARVLGVRHTTALGVLRPLTDRGLIERQPHPYSARQQVLALTEAGRALLVRLEAVDSALAGALAALPVAEFDALEAGLSGLAEGLTHGRLLVLPAPCQGCVHFEADADLTSDAPHYCRLIRRHLRDEASRMPCPEHQAERPAGARHA
jgi:DNA-binding MarR family transcriptional regulator